MFDHPLREVEEDRRWRPRFAVDAHGILRRAKSRARVRHRWFFDERPVRRWLGERRIRRVGDRFQWWLPAKRNTNRKGQPEIRWRAVGFLDEEDEKFLLAIPEDVRERLLTAES